ncbi:IG [Globodera pallida]|nr:IG [Globodera pallida]
MFRLLSMGGRLCALLPILLSNLPNTSTGAPLRWEWEPPASTERSEEETADLHCPARGIPPPLIRWSFNAVPFHEWAEDGRRILLDGGKLLRIRTLKRDLDTGLYQCNATSPEGTLAAATFLNVQGKATHPPGGNSLPNQMTTVSFAPHFRHSAHRVWKVLRGTSVDFPCDVRAAPKARVRWVDANDTAIVGVKGKLEFLSNHTLRLNDLSSVDDGFYYCNVSNRYGINRAMNRLEVFNPTYFAEVPQPESLTRDAFESVEFRCRAVADPRLTLEYVWTRDGKRIEQSARTDADGASLLQLNKLRGRNSGRVECSVVTDVDAKTASVHLTVRDVPEPPEVLRVDCSSGQHALVVWRRRAENGAPLTHFTVDALGTRERNANWQKVWEEKVGEEKAKRAMFKAAIPLAPWVNYTFRMFAHNAYGASDPATAPLASSPCATPPDVPFSNPSAVLVQGTEPDNLVIRWTPLARNVWNAPGLKYLVRYRQMDESEWHEFFVEDPFANHTIVREQPTFRPFLVQVRAVNTRGFSAVEPETEMGWSGEDVPLEAPRNLRLVGHRNHSTAELEWEALLSESSVRGHFRGFRVDHWPSARPFLITSQIVPNTSTRATISALQALTNYGAKVHVLNGQYISEASNLLTFKTIEGAPSKVHDLRVHSVGSRTLLATWEPPLHPNGNLRGFYLAFENLSSGIAEETFVLRRQLFYLHELLSPETPFRVAVWAETGGGEGPRTWRHTRTWPLRAAAPFPPRRCASVGFRRETLPPRFIGAWSSEWHQTVPIVLPQTVLDVRGLAEGTDYVLIGEAREGPKRRRQSVPVTVRTESSRAMPPFSRERLRSAAWFLAVLIACALTFALLAVACVVAQRSAGGIPFGFVALRRREKRFGPALRFRTPSSSTGEEELGPEGLDWLSEGGDAHKRFLLEAQRRLSGALDDKQGQKQLKKNSAAMKTAADPPGAKNGKIAEK